MFTFMFSCDGEVRSLLLCGLKIILDDERFFLFFFHKLCGPEQLCWGVKAIIIGIKGKIFISALCACLPIEIFFSYRFSLPTCSPSTLNLHLPEGNFGNFGAGWPLASSVYCHVQKRSYARSLVYSEQKNCEMEFRICKSVSTCCTIFFRFIWFM